MRVIDSGVSRGQLKYSTDEKNRDFKLFYFLEERLVFTKQQRIGKKVVQ